jgi:hypothetical protein
MVCNSKVAVVPNDVTQVHPCQRVCDLGFPANACSKRGVVRAFGEALQDKFAELVGKRVRAR